jgi:hypothetical protein
MTTDNTLSVALRDEIKELLSPLIIAAEQPEGIQLLLQSIGRTGELGSRPDLRAEIARLAALGQGFADLDDDALGSWEGLASVLNLSCELLTALQRLESVVSDPSLAEQCEDLGLDLVQSLVALHLRARHPAIFRASSLLTLITPAELSDPIPPVISDSNIVRSARLADQFHLGRIANLLKQPLQTLAEKYFPNELTAAQNAHEAESMLFPILALLAQTLGLSSFNDRIRAIQEPDPAPPEDNNSDHFSGDEPGEEADPQILEPGPVDLTSYYETFLPRFVFAIPGSQDSDGALTPARFAVSTLISSAAHPGGARGLVITPLGQLDWSEERGGWRFSLESSGQVPAFVLGPGGVSQAPSGSPLTNATARLSIERVGNPEAPAFIVGAANGTRLEIGALRFATDVRVAPSQSEVTLAAKAQSGALVLAPGDGDGFLNAVLPNEGLKCEFDLGLELSSERGLRFSGAAGLDATLPVGLSVGGATIPTLYLGLRADESGLKAEVSAIVGVSLGPVQASIDRVGVAAAVTFPEDGGNLGVANLDLGFKYPNGVGLSIDKAGVSGGGYLYLDKDKGQYAGVVQLNLQGDISVKGIGLIATRLPDNSKGFSLIVIITAEDFKPIPLPLGFKLTGIGGLLAINRTFDEEVLRAGLKNNTLDSVLFPKDPVRNAPQILSNLNKVFPIAKGHHMFGPVAQISWGAKGLLTANLALALELGERLRLLILAQIAVILPRPENDLIRLKMDAVGLIDFDRGMASLDATLHDSRLLKKFTLTGDMAMRLKWEGGPNFALAVGGLHPAFNPPPNFPKLERVAINLSSGDNPRIRCEAYFALTSNTVQFGARAELYAEALGFSVHGDIGFDVLIQFDPFQFVADFHAQVQLKRGSRNLFKVRLEGELSGPRPLRIKAKATFEVLWMDVSFRVDKTLVSGEKPEAPAPVDVMPLLKEALGDPGAWTAKLPVGQKQMVTLRATPGVASDVLLHPLGALTVKQNVVPLNMEISRFGQTTPAGERRFTITDVYVGETHQAAPPTVKDFFARGQYIEMSDGEKLSTPSFESMTAGVAIGSDGIAIGDDWLEVEAIRFETLVVNKEQNETRRSASGMYELRPEHMEKQSRFGAAGASELRRSGRARYRGAAPKYRIVKEGWSIAATSNLTEQPSPVVQSYSEAAQALRELTEENPAMAAGLKILRPSELSAG